MSLLEKAFHSLLLGALFTIINWLVIDKFIIELTFTKYIFIEIVLVISIKFYKFTKLKLGLN